MVDSASDNVSPMSIGYTGTLVIADLKIANLVLLLKTIAKARVVLNVNIGDAIAILAALEGRETKFGSASSKLTLVGKVVTVHPNAANIIGMGDVIA